MPRGEHVSEFLTPREWDAILLLRKHFGLDATRTYQFHEALVARMVDGTLTAHKAAWDVNVQDIRIEVKFAAEVRMLFHGGRRPVFKWAQPTGAGKDAKCADVTVFIGIDPGDELWAWVVPTDHVRRCASITLTSPRVRYGSDRSVISQWQVPYSQLLPEILRRARLNDARTA